MTTTPQQTLMETRMRTVTKNIKDFYSSNPDAAVYNKMFIDTLAQCMAKKIVYGVKYPEIIESQLNRFNYGAGRRSSSSSPTLTTKS